MTTQVENLPATTPTPEAPVEGYTRPKHAPRSLFDPPIVKRAVLDAFVKLNPRLVAKNPVMFVVEVGSVITTVLLLRDLFTGGHNLAFGAQITPWLWVPVLLANLADTM